MAMRRWEMRIGDQDQDKAALFGRAMEELDSMVHQER